MDSEKSESERISGMDALLFAIALEVVLLQMRVHDCSTQLRLASKPLDQRGKLKYEKLVRDSDLVKDVVRRTLIDVAEDGAWISLEQAINLLQERFSSAANERTEHEKLKMTLEEASNELATKRKKWVVKLRDSDHKTAFLRDKMKDDLLNAKARLRYTEMWLRARLEEQEYRARIEIKPAPIPSAEHEQRVHEEICRALELQIQEREKSTEYWSSRYAEDILDMNKRLTEMRQQLTVAMAKHDELQKLYNLHEGEMRAWLTFKEQRAARLAREQRIRDAATRLQSWWRGLMVRKALGSFKFLKNLKKTPSKSKKK